MEKGPITKKPAHNEYAISVGNSLGGGEGGVGNEKFL